MEKQEKYLSGYPCLLSEAMLINILLSHNYSGQHTCFVFLLTLNVLITTGQTTFWFFFFFFFCYCFSEKIKLRFSSDEDSHVKPNLIFSEKCYSFAKTLRAKLAKSLCHYNLLYADIQHHKPGIRMAKMKWPTPKTSVIPLEK